MSTPALHGSIAKMKYRLPSEPKKSRAHQMRVFFYDKKTKKICGRTWQHWIMLVMYYVAAYSLFAAFFIILLTIDYKTRNKVVPENNIYGFQPIIQEPGMAAVPTGVLNRAVNTIHMSDAKRHIDEINKFLQDYPAEENLTDCVGLDRPKTCRMRKDLETLGLCSPASDPSFGYAVNEPCIILKVNKVWGWRPKLLTDRPGSISANANLSIGSIPVTCEVWQRLQEKLYKGRFQEVKFYPSAGINGNCFPFCGKSKPYVQPFVMAKFTGLSKDEPIGVLCVLHAENIIDSRTNIKKIRDNIGSFGFVLAISRCCERSINEVLFLLPVITLATTFQLPSSSLG